VIPTANKLSLFRYLTQKFSVDLRVSVLMRGIESKKLEKKLCYKSFNSRLLQNAMTLYEKNSPLHVISLDKL